MLFIGDIYYYINVSRFDVGVDSADFIVDQSSGEISTGKVFDRETTSSYSIVLKVDI